YQVLVATHFNTGTYHNHFVVNSVGLWDGRKFNCGKRAYYQFRQLSDDLCREYQLSTIKNPKGKTPRSIYFAEKKGEPTKYNLMREALDAALKVSVDGSDLRKALREQGYELDANPAHKYATLRRIGSKKAVRLYRLGEGYDLPALRERIEENRRRYAYDLGYQRYKPMPVQRYRPKRLGLNGSFRTVKKIGGFRGLYLHYCYCLGILPKNSVRKPLSPELREECRRLDAISRQAELICREKLDTAEDAADFISTKKTELKELGATRQKCYNRLRRCNDGAEIARIKTQRDRLTAAMAACRRDIQTAEGILSRSGRLKENLKLEQEMQSQRMGRAAQKKRERSVAR
ncbi:MAG: relaxase/mobilization nuclease domain-containing protein, partial [Oscillospiraceae bacterium]|nr:relaxase/mobilization nuclease domain-containing protein [Oscillospiraceae bacterium]